MISEVDLTDHWPMKHVTPNLYNDSCEVTQGVPPLNYQWFVRIAVQRLARYNVIFNLGNEGFDCFPEVTVAWEDAIYSVARQAMIDAGIPLRPIGSTHKLGQIGAAGRKTYDYVTVHGWGFQPPLPDKPVLLTENDNQVHSPAEFRALEQQYKDAGMSWGAWRGPVDDAEWYQIVGASYAGNGTETASVCLFNEWKQWVDYQAQPGLYPNDAWFEKINAAEWAVVSERPDLFASNGCLHQNTERNRIDVASLIQQKLQPTCVIVGSTDCPTCNPFSDMDSFDVRLDLGGPVPQSGVYCGQHYIHHGNGCLIPVRNAFRDCGQYTVQEPVGPQAQSCGALGGDTCHQGGAACPTTHDPVPSSDCDLCCKPKSAPSECPLAGSDVVEMQVKAKPTPGTQQVDVTPIACGPLVTAVLNACGANCCYLSPEKGPVNAACGAKLYGNPEWRVPVGSDLRLVQVGDSTYTMKVAEGGPVDVLVLGIDARATIKLNLFKGSPACKIDPLDHGICLGSTNKGSSANP
jgi:hypothetical protein